MFIINKNTNANTRESLFISPLINSEGRLDLEGLVCVSHYLLQIQTQIKIQEEHCFTEVFCSISIQGSTFHLMFSHLEMRHVQ